MIVANSILSARWRLQGARHSADSRRSGRATPRVDRCHSGVSTRGTVFDSTGSARPASGFILASRRGFFPRIASEKPRSQVWQARCTHAACSNDGC